MEELNNLKEEINLELELGKLKSKLFALQCLKEQCKIQGKDYTPLKKEERKIKRDIRGIEKSLI